MDTRDVIRLNLDFLVQQVQPLLDNESISFHYRFHDAKVKANAIHFSKILTALPLLIQGRVYNGDDRRDER